MQHFSMTEAYLRQHATPASFQRGDHAARSGMVQTIIQRGNSLEGEVHGTRSYHVSCTIHEDSSMTAICTCPYEWGGWCKHIVAVCLVTLRQPEQVEQHPFLADVVATMTKEQMQTLLLHLAERDPQIASLIERHAASDGKPGAQTSVEPDAALIRRDVRRAMRVWGSNGDDEDEWHPEAHGHAYGVTDELTHLLKQAGRNSDSDDGHAALAILAPLTEAFVEEYERLAPYDEEGEGIAFLQQLGEAWTKALLTASLNPTERATWQDRLETWQEVIADWDTPFDVAIGAAAQGWDDPPLRRVLQGKRDATRIWAGEPPEYARELTLARLRVLERREHIEEYLRLARAEEAFVAYTTKLVQLGRADEAAAYGHAHLRSPEDALALAQALNAHGAHEQALQIAERGLNVQMQADSPNHPDWSLRHGRLTLALWLRDTAAQSGETERALAAATIAFRATISLEDYQQVRTLASASWPTLRAELLELTRQQKPTFTHGNIEIFLEEGLLDEAIAATEPLLRSPNDSFGRPIIERVIAAAATIQPEWALHAARTMAEPIMEGGWSGRYAEAAHWLEYVRLAYRTSNQEDDWQTYLSELLAKHKRKYTLRPLLEHLKSE